MYRSDTGLFLVASLAQNMTCMMMIKRKRISREKVIEYFSFNFVIIYVTVLCEIIGSKKEVHHPVEQRQSLPEDQDEQGVSSYNLCL